MKLKKGYKVREVAGNYMLLPYGEESINFNCIFSMSESAAWLWNALQDKEFDESEALSLILGEYDVDEVTALTDIRSVIKSWKENGILDE